jgi:OTU domain-containing protein 3
MLQLWLILIIIYYFYAMGKQPHNNKKIEHELSQQYGHNRVTRSRTKGQRSKVAIEKECQNSNEEFPILQRLGLYASEIKGDGNCLFRALGDQYYGDGGATHVEIRQKIVDYMSRHADYFKMFLGAGDGGESWNAYLKRMARDGVYGDNPEIVAFANCYKANVVIYQDDHMYIVPCQHDKEQVREVHIAYHSWEHYSSVRNQDGPHTGFANIAPKDKGVIDTINEQVKNDKGSGLAPNWQLKVVRDSLPFPCNDEQISHYLTIHNGDISSTVEELLMSSVDLQDQMDQEVAMNGSEGGVEHDRVQGETNAPRVNGDDRAKPKRMTARERKEKQKREAWERKRRAKAVSTPSAAPPILSNPAIPTISQYVADSGIKATFI